jgi:hypothetical protein
MLLHCEHDEMPSLNLRDCKKIETSKFHSAQYFKSVTWRIQIAMYISANHSGASTIMLRYAMGV